MAKGKRKKDAEESARTRLAEAQAKLQSAQEERARVQKAGEESVERARARSAARLDRVTRKVERRAGRVARAEARLYGLRRPGAREAGPAANIRSSPQEVADHLEEVQAETDAQTEPDSIVTPVEVSMEPSAEPAAEGIDSYARRLLTALNDGFGQGGATYTEWLAAAGISKRVFLRARRSLFDAGLVVRTGDGYGAHYVLSPSGQEALAGG